jgi:protein-S-isoprenylcysteine O-methyltransferase Ste14
MNERMSRMMFFVYGVVCYAIFFATFLYTIGFLGNAVVPKTVDSGEMGGLGAAIAIDLALLGLFGVQHSVMARRGFKAWWTKIVPTPIERSTYVLASSLVLILLFWQWRPLPQVIFSATGPAASVAYAAFALGWLVVLYSTFLINHFDLFGLRQVFLHLRSRPITPLTFKTPVLYRLVRHPLYVGWLLCFWATPTMTFGRFLFAAVTTAYIFVAIRFEERDLVAAHGTDYERYRARTPMMVPRLRPSREEADRRGASEPLAAPKA